ncbi:hypothetical protein ACLKA7_010371 [Drosophila subpalustris]
MSRTCFCLILVSVLSVVSAASLGYLPRRMQQHTPTQTQQQQQIQGQAYFYNAPNSNTMAALRRIILGHLQRFQEADRQRALMVHGKTEAQRQSYRQSVIATLENGLGFDVPQNTPTPKNYAMNFLPEGRDVVPGTSYIPLRLLLLIR